MAPMPEAVYATLLMTDSYLPGDISTSVSPSLDNGLTDTGAMVLAHSLKDGGTNSKIVVLVTLETVSGSSITELKTVYDEVVPVNKIVNKTPANLFLMDRPDLISTFTKIELWRQTQFSHVVYIDADAVALRAPDELLRLNTNFAAAPDVGWPDCFNSGVMVLRPNLGDYYSLLALAQRGISFDGADQGLLNMHFREWERLSFTYNCTPSGNYQYVPAYRHFQSSISVVHFIGQDKPWVQGRYWKHSGVYDELVGRWWATYDRHYRISKTSYGSNQSLDASRGVQSYVVGEADPAVYGFSTASPPPSHSESFQPLPVLITSKTAEATNQKEPGTDQSPQQAQSETEPKVPTEEDRRLPASHTSWDAARAPPPSNSQPEASNFPSARYSMSQDTQLFQPPRTYPEAPKDMWYQVPSTPPAAQKPRPIFPWETKSPKPTRIFPEEMPSSPEASVTSPPASTATAGETQSSTQGSPSTPTIKTEDSDPWQAFNRSNAWDQLPAIDRYLQALSQARKGKVQVIHQSSVSESSEGIHSPPLEDTQRWPSMKLTDFPTEIERPSLPVTPTPRRRPTFWGEERDEAGKLPQAEGVPKQEDWNPVQRLEELQRRQSEVLERGAPPSPPSKIPEREMPQSGSTATVAALNSQSSSSSAPPPPLMNPFSNSLATREDVQGKETSPEVSASA